MTLTRLGERMARFGWGGDGQRIGSGDMSLRTMLIARAMRDDTSG